MKITEYPAITSFTDDNVMLVDGTDGTKQMLIEDAILAALHHASPLNHRWMVRHNSDGSIGKNLGSSVTTEQLAAIQAGTFNGLWLADYWEIADVNYRIWDYNYLYNAGDTAFTKPHLIIMPDTCLYNAQMNTSNVTTGGYVGSAMYTSNLSNAKTIINSAFGDAVLTHREYFTNAVSNGYPSGGTWYDSSVELPNEIMMYGCRVFSPSGDGSFIPNNYTVNKKPLALAMIAPEFVNIRASYWLRDVVSSTYFARVNGDGSANCHGASGSSGVRPYFAIG